MVPWYTYSVGQRTPENRPKEMWSQMPDTTVKVKEPTLADMKKAKDVIEETAKHRVTMDEVIRIALEALKAQLHF